MGTFEDVSKSASPQEKLRRFSFESEPPSAATFYAANAPGTNVPSRNTCGKDLRIEVPRSAASPRDLTDPFDFHESDISGILPDGNSITQLPTPVLPTGASFRSPALPHTLVHTGHIDVRKRYQHSGRSGSPGGGRIVSAFEPETPLKLRSDICSVPSSVLLQARHTSNPADFPVLAAGRRLEMPLPPSEPSEAVFTGRILHAPRLHKTFVCDDVVGSGAFSTVVSAHDTASESDACDASDASKAPKTVVAVKIISYVQDDVTTASSFRSFIVRELSILTHLNHPCIIKLIDYNVSPPVTPDELELAYELKTPPVEYAVDDARENRDFVEQEQLFFLDYCPGGNLFNWLSRSEETGAHIPMFWRFITRVVAELMMAVAHMHRKRIIHRDIKLENILLNEKFDCETLEEDPRFFLRPVSTITDFGLSKRLVLDDQLLTTKCGSQDYVSPELLMGLKYNGKLLDSWAIGVLVYSILENRLPFDLPLSEFVQSVGVSPSVLKRRRSRHSPAHRIAMIDWDWYRVSTMEKDASLEKESLKIVSNLKLLVEKFLVRKERRLTVEQVLESEQFAWIKACVPGNFYC